MKLAPTLQELVFPPDSFLATMRITRARAELRALLAVARAAKRLSTCNFRMDGGLYMGRLLDAQARLERVSKGGP